MMGAVSRGIDLHLAMNHYGRGMGPPFPRASCGILLGLDQEQHFHDCTRGSCSQVCRPGSLAARWEYRNDPYFQLETVRAVTAYHVCTHP